nr:MAG TPA: hypothetical protein [Caudoviricetes sp.]
MQLQLYSFFITSKKFIQFFTDSLKSFPRERSTDKIKSISKSFSLFIFHPLF